MSWLNLNQSLNSLKGQITNFASEVLSEGATQDSSDETSSAEPAVKELEAKCRGQELEIAALKRVNSELEATLQSEIAALKRVNSELEATLQSERLSRKNGVKEEESSWYWDPPAQASKPDSAIENHYNLQLRALQDEISSLKERDTLDVRNDAEEELTRLREENRNLTTNLEDLDNQHQLAMERLLTLKKELQKNFEVLKQEHEDLKSSNEEYSIENQSLLSKIGERDEEIRKLKATNTEYDTIHHKYMNLEKVHSLMRENAEKFQEENQELHEEVFKLQEQVTKLEHEIEIGAKHSELSNMVPREQYEELLKELNDLKDRRNSNQFHLDEVNIDDNAKSVIETLKRDITELKHKLAQKDDSYDHRVVKADKIMQLYNKYVNFELPIDYIGEIPSDDNIVMYKLESVFKTVNSFKKDIDALEHKLSEKNHNINHLQTQIDDLTTENDFLTTDIQHYEGELNEMKKNNDFLISEIAALKNTSKLEPIIETHEDNLAKLETELADINRINKTFESEIKLIESELSAVKVEKMVLQESLNDLKLKYTAMLSELETCKTETKACEELESTASYAYNEKLKQALDEIDDLKKRLNGTNARNEQLSIDIHIKENDKVLLTKQVDDLKHALEEQSAAYKELETIKVSLDHKLQDIESKLDEVIKHKTEIESRKSNLEHKVSVLESEVLSKENSTELHAEFEKIKIEKDKLTEKLNETVKENSTLLETMNKLTHEISSLRLSESQKSTISHDCSKIESDNKVLRSSIEDLKNKVIEQELQKNQIINLKDNNQKILESKLQLEAELLSTNNKIDHMEDEFVKHITELNEKDLMIIQYKETIAQNNKTLSELHENVTDLRNSVDIKNQEIQNLTQSLKEVSEKLNDTTIRSDRNFDELQRLHTEKEDISKQVFSMNEEIVAKVSEISNLTKHLEELERNCTEYKTTIENKDKEIKELNQSIVELTDKIKITDNINHHDDEYARQLQEKKLIENQVSELKTNLTIIEKEHSDMKLKYDQLEHTCLEYKTGLDNATIEKAELINLINLKHNESIQYHNEIQRLNHVLLEQTNEFQNRISENAAILQNQTNCCSNCEQISLTLKEKDEIIMKLHQNSTDHEKMKADLLNASETIKSLTGRCENLDRSMAIQLEIVKKLTAENLQLSEQEQNSTRELERLRHHLVELEENYTQELMTSEQKLTECQTRLHQIEERAKQTSTVYTSNSIRANQEVETLRNQIKLLEKQRDDVQARLSEADDARSRSEAALTNLQIVLEQFQLDKERDIHTATEKIRNKMEELKRQNNGLQDEIARLNAKLEEALTGLQAATRLGDQVETKTAQINDLKEQVRALETSVAAAEERYHNATSNQQDKVDKNLVKNLVINFVMTAQNSLNKMQVLRILSTVLDFNQQECERLGLVRSATAPDSLAAEFVKFLQDESRPRAPLPNMMGIAQNSSRSTTPTSRRSSTLGPQPTPFDLGHNRNLSTGSNNLLFQNIENETSSQVSIESERDVRVVGMDTGVNQTRNTEGAILTQVLKDI